RIIFQQQFKGGTPWHTLAVNSRRGRRLAWTVGFWPARNRRRGDRMKRRRDTEPLTVVWILLTASAAFAAEPMAPSDIQATFFNGEPFTASTPGGTKFRMTFTPDGKMTREPPRRIRPEEQWHVET